jgi:hypothetical protein
MCSFGQLLKLRRRIRSTRPLMQEEEEEEEEEEKKKKKIVCFFKELKECRRWL